MEDQTSVDVGTSLTPIYGVGNNYVKIKKIIIANSHTDACNVTLYYSTPSSNERLIKLVIPASDSKEFDLDLDLPGNLSGIASDTVYLTAKFDVIPFGNPPVLATPE